MIIADEQVDSVRKEISAELLVMLVTWGLIGLQGLLAFVLRDVVFLVRLTPPNINRTRRISPKSVGILFSCRMVIEA